MTVASFALILSGVLLNALAQLLLKAGTNSIGQPSLSFENAISLAWRFATEPHILGGIACYVVSVVLWILALSRVEVSVAYPMLSIGYVVTSLAAWYWLGESVSAMRLIGIGIIVVGVFVVARS